jgi:uncharacterized membrane protein YbhN (UPF0104 family)
MAGMSLGPGEVMVVIAGMNLIGALATFTIAGIGVSEGGLALLLTMLGHPTSVSAAIALAVRPLALASSVAVCGLVEAAVRLCRLKRGATRPISETTEALE